MPVLGLFSTGPSGAVRPAVAEFTCERHEVVLAGSRVLPHGRRPLFRQARRHPQDQGGLPPDTEGAFYPAVLIGDVNGDKCSDLLVGRSRHELRVFLGVPEPNLFARRPQKVAVAMPSDEEYAWLVDLNKDGKQDLLMHQPSTTEPHRLTVLIAR